MNLDNPAELFLWARHSQATIKAFMDDLKASAAAGEAIPGLHLTEGQEREAIPDTARAFDVLTGLYVPEMIQFLAGVLHR